MTLLATTARLLDQRSDLANWQPVRWQPIEAEPVAPSVAADIAAKRPHFLLPQTLLGIQKVDPTPTTDLLVALAPGIFEFRPTLVAWPYVMPTYAGSPLSELPQIRASRDTPLYLVAEWVLLPPTANLSRQLGCVRARIEARAPTAQETNDNSPITKRTTRTWWHPIGTLTPTGFTPDGLISPFYPPSWPPF